MTNDLRELVDAMEPHAAPEPNPETDEPAVEAWETDGGAPPPSEPESPPVPESRKRYFAAGPEGDFERYETEEEAINAAREWLDIEAEAAAEDCWSELQLNIAWGVVIGSVREVASRELTAEEKRRHGVDYFVNYDLSEDKTSIQAFWRAQAEWSTATFGSDAERGPVGPLKHLEKEAREAYGETDVDRRRVEIADCLFLVIDAARRAGMTWDELVDTAWAKLAINKARQWQKPTSDGPVEHVRTEGGDA